MSDQPIRPAPPREVIAPRHESIKAVVGRDAGPPPLGYGEVRLWLVASGPRALFAYWEFNPAEHPEAITGEGPARFYLRILRNHTVENTVEIHPDARAWHLTAHQSEANYTAELGFFTAQKIWCFLARSRRARTPPEAAAPAPATEPPAHGPAPAPAKDPRRERRRKE